MSLSGISIAGAHPSEAEALSALAILSKRHWGYPDNWMSRWKEVLTITSEMITTQNVFVAWMDGQIVGFGVLTIEADQLWLNHLWVLPSAMGRGIGRALFCHAKQQSMTLGFSEFVVESDPHAAGFYMNMGAQLVRTSVTWMNGWKRELPVFRCQVS